jgi:hypothetical protein
MAETPSQRIQKRRSAKVCRPRVAEEPAQPKRVLPLSLQTAIEEDPRFRITTRDGRQWIDPIAGTAVRIRTGATIQETARDFFMRNLEAWREHGVQEQDRLLETCWRYNVMGLLNSDKRRMTVFDKHSGFWLNPFTGVVEESVTRDQGKITAATVKAMASVLAACRQAQTGALLSKDAIRKLKVKLGYEDPFRMPTPV